MTLSGGPGAPLLEGLLVGKGTRIAIVAPPHPLLGGHLSNPVVQAVAEGFVTAGLRCLLFNFRGTGESLGEPSGDPADADQDYETALTAATLHGDVRIAAGYSFGGAAAIRVGSARPSIQVFAVAPPPALLSATAVSALAHRLVIAVGEHDPIAPLDELRMLGPSRLEPIGGADHFFARGMDRVRRLAEQTGLGSPP